MTPSHDITYVGTVEVEDLAYCTIECRCGWTTEHADPAEARRRHAVHHDQPAAAEGLASARAAIRKATE